MSGLDRDAARDVVIEAIESGPAAGLSDGERKLRIRGILDALEGCVRPCPPAAVDRDALLRELMMGAPGPAASPFNFKEHADRILALLRPAGGVTLTPDEAALAVYALTHVRGDWQTPPMRALAARLEAASND